MDDRLRLPAPGEIIQAGGSNYHVRLYGRSDLPLLLLECGLGMMSSCWAYLAPALASDFQVLTYDRAGLGWSDERNEPRASAQIARELLGLLDVAAPAKSVHFLGHSMGATHGRALCKLAAGRVQTLVFLDGAHTEQMKRVRRIRARMRNYFLYLEGSALLARHGLSGSWSDSPLMHQVQGLPPAEQNEFRRFFHSVRHLRTTSREAKAWEQSADFLREEHLGNLPLVVITAQKNSFPRWDELQKDLATLSTNAEQVTLTECSHLSLICTEEHARRAAAEIRQRLAPPAR